MNNPSEKEIQKTILEYLTLRRIFHWRNNSGAMKTDAGHMYFFGTPGSPDVLAIHEGVFYGIEVKKVGGKQSENQKAFQAGLEKAGGKYVLAMSVDDVRAAGL